MRTTITLDDSVLALVHRVMAERGLTFKEVVNDAIRLAFGSAEQETGFRTPTFDMGFEPAVPWDKALRLAAELEDEELVRKLAERK
jgi:hypothetical protein